ncbi:MAG: 6,7-dimethyl-8-ribityllumazine synthase [Flavobacteriaceae bacterium]|nr:6,7-dimethyl-8-ribityllumazine synthase [Flavobacteriaceae bacterium]
MSSANYNLDLTNVPNAENKSFGIVVSEWNDEITNNLLIGSLDLLKSKGVLKKNIHITRVPGSFELIYGCKKMQDKNVDAIIAIGSLIRGETSHFDYICQSTSQGIKDLNVQGKSPVIFCVLTDDTLQQALDRSGGKFGNKGEEAAIAAIKMSFI